MKKTILKNIKVITGYLLFCIAALVLFIYLLFPRTGVRTRIIYEIGKSTSTEVNTSEDKWIFPFGLIFKGMVFTKKDNNVNHTVAHIDKLGIEIPVKSIFSLSPVSNLSADIYGGTARGLLTLRSENRLIQANWTNVDISRIEALKEIPAELTGRISGDIVLRLINNIPEGQIRLLIKDGKLSKIKVMGFPFPDLPVDEIQGLVDIKGDSFSLKDIRFKNNDLKGAVNGGIRLPSGTGSGELNISIRFTVGEKIRKEYQGMLSFIEKTKDKEGYYTIQIKGDLKKPVINI
jgi:type II secretion system protein N